MQVNEFTRRLRLRRLDVTIGDVACAGEGGSEHQELLLDEALAETFPASDPIAVGALPVRPGRRGIPDAKVAAGR